MTSFGGAVGRGGLFGLDRTFFNSSSSGSGGLHPFLKDQRQQKEEQKVKMQMTVRKNFQKFSKNLYFFVSLISTNQNIYTSSQSYIYSLSSWILSFVFFFSSLSSLSTKHNHTHMTESNWYGPLHGTRIIFE